MMSTLCNRFRTAQIGDFRYNDLKWLAGVTRSDHYLHVEAIKLAEDDYAGRRRLAEMLNTYLDVGDDQALLLDGQPIDIFEMTLNSALAWGNRSIQLAAKLHGQCEIHAYCEGPNRAWLADLIDEAVGIGVFRPEPWGYDGWGAVSEFLRCDDAEPVVTSYSVTDSFPNPSLVPDDIKLGEDDPWEAWSQFTEQQRWQWGMDILRNERGLQISPDRLAVPFGCGLTGEEFIRRAHASVTAVETKNTIRATPNPASPGGDTL